MSEAVGNCEAYFAKSYSARASISIWTGMWTNKINEFRWIPLEKWPTHAEKLECHFLQIGWSSWQLWSKFRKIIFSKAINFNIWTGMWTNKINEFGSIPIEECLNSCRKTRMSLSTNWLKQLATVQLISQNHIQLGNIFLYERVCEQTKLTNLGGYQSKSVQLMPKNSNVTFYKLVGAVGNWSSEAVGNCEANFAKSYSARASISIWTGMWTNKINEFRWISLEKWPTHAEILECHFQQIGWSSWQLWS